MEKKPREDSGSAPEWSQEAKAALEKVPEFAREMAREMIEQFARDESSPVVTPELMKRARARFGM